MNQCKHKWIYDGIFKFELKKPIEQFVQIRIIGEKKLMRFSKGFTNFMDKHQFHCEKCCEVRRKR